jgi:GR25 family glycosyltransferase involved in LPS biosynthesis
MIKAFVITIMDLPESVEAADKCIASGKKNGLTIEKWPAFTPKDDPKSIFQREGIPETFFREVTSRQTNCMSAFLSHRSLWKECIRLNREIIIFEHDAKVVAPIPEFMPYTGCINLGAPSYGTYRTPTTLGIIPLTSKDYFPGAHAYRLKPIAAKTMIDRASTDAAPTDLFLSYNNFDWLQEYYPWTCVAQDTFSTIQNEGGCVAKHSWRKDKTQYRLFKHD